MNALYVFKYFLLHSAQKRENHIILLPISTVKRFLFHVLWSEIWLNFQVGRRFSFPHMKSGSWVNKVVHLEGIIVCKLKLSEHSCTKDFRNFEEYFSICKTSITVIVHGRFTTLTGRKMMSAALTPLEWVAVITLSSHSIYHFIRFSLEADGKWN